MKKLITISLVALTSCAAPKQSFLVIGYQIVRGDSINIVKRIKPAEPCKPMVYPVGTIICCGKVKIIK